MTTPEERAAQFVQKWKELDLTEAVATEVVRAYISIGLGLGDDTAARFINEDYSAYREVGNAQSRVPNDHVPAFWGKIREVLPDLHSEEETQWLAENSKSIGMCWFLWTVAGPSMAYDLLNLNAHAYK